MKLRNTDELDQILNGIFHFYVITITKKGMLLHTPDFEDKFSLKILNSQKEKLRNQSHSPLQQYLGLNI